MLGNEDSCRGRVGYFRVGEWKARTRGKVTLSTALVSPSDADDQIAVASHWQCDAVDIENDLSLHLSRSWGLSSSSENVRTCLKAVERRSAHDP